MSERLLLLGENRDLVATLCGPAAAPDDRVVVFLNAGLVPRQGPHRNHVKWARALAGTGATTIRIDLAGIGDSAPGKPATDPGARHLPDLRLLLDWIEENLPGRRVFLAGICLGAAHSWRAFKEDQRVTGAFLIDPWFYDSVRSRLLKTPAKLRQTRLVRSAATLVKRMLGRPTAGQRSQAAWITVLRPPAADMIATIAACRGTGRKLKFLYTRSWSPGYRYAGQLADALGMPDVDAELWLEANHTFTEPCQQERLAAVLDEWTRRP